MNDDPDRIATLERDLTHLVPEQFRSPRHAYIAVISGDDSGAIYRLNESKTVIGRVSSCDITLSDEGVSRRHASVSRSEKEVYVLEDLESTNGTYLDGKRLGSQELQDGDRFQVGDSTLLRFSLTDEFEERFQRRLHNASIQDSLTGLSNRKYFDRQLATEIAFASRHGTSLSLLMIDLDLFKAVNDTHGHLAGDRVLERLGALLGSAVRTEDVVARIGGEEFAILARGIGLEQACMLAERLRRTVAKRVITFDGIEIRVTTSIGVAGVIKDCVETGADLIKSADDALYQAKRRGRNTVVSALPMVITTPSPAPFEH